MIAVISDDFADSVKKHAALKKVIQKKVKMILQNPIGLGEPLKGNFRGNYSAPVKMNFLIVYLYCMICRRKGDNAIVLCHDCSICVDETVKFVALGPHDDVYSG